MTEMKGLVRRLVYVSWPNFRALLAMNAVMVIIVLLCGISFQCGNLRTIYDMAAERDPEFEKEFSEMFGIMIAMLNFMAGMLPASIDVDAVLSDIRSGWNRFAYTLPVSMKKYAAANYILAGGLTVCMFAFIAVFDLLCYKLFGQPYDPAPVAVSILIITVIFVIGRLFFNLVLKVGDQEKALKYIVITVVVLVLLFPVSFIVLIEGLLPALGMDEDDIPGLVRALGGFLGRWLWLFPVVIAAILYLSYRRTVKLLERRMR